MRIKGQSDIEVFISDGGYICLKQKRDLDGEQVIELAQAKFDKALPVDD